MLDIGWTELRVRLHRVGGCVILLGATYVFFVLSRSGQEIDAAALGTNVLNLPLAVQLAVFGPLRSGLIPLLALAAVVLGCLALWRARRRLVLITLGCTVLTVVATETLKRLLGRPDLDVASYDHSTWPSGHTAAAAALALACQRLYPAEKPPCVPRWVTWLLVVVVTLAQFASVASYAHRPSDTVGAVLLAGAVFFAFDARRDHVLSRVRVLTGVVLPLTGAVLLLLANAANPELDSSIRTGATVLGLWAASAWVLLPLRNPRVDAALREI